MADTQEVTGTKRTWQMTDDRLRLMAGHQMSSHVTEISATNTLPNSHQTVWPDNLNTI